MLDSNAQTEIAELRKNYLDGLVETVETMDQHAAQLKKAAKVKTSYPLLLYLAHQVKGTGGTLGFPKISEVAREMAAELEEFLDRDVPVSRADLSKNALARVAQLRELIGEHLSE